MLPCRAFQHGLDVSQAHPYVSYPYKKGTVDGLSNVRSQGTFACIASCAKIEAMSTACRLVEGSSLSDIL